jgi:hypothetical protein
MVYDSNPVFGRLQLFKSANVISPDLTRDGNSKVKDRVGQKFVSTIYMSDFPEPSVLAAEKFKIGGKVRFKWQGALEGAKKGFKFDKDATDPCVNTMYCVQANKASCVGAQDKLDKAKYTCTFAADGSYVDIQL